MSDNNTDKKFKNKSELQKYAEQQFNSLLIATQTISQLRSTVEELKKELAAYKEKEEESKIIVVPVSDEELICRSQIQKLYGKAINQELTLEETKRLDLLIKNLYLIKNNGKTKSLDGESKKIPDNLSQEELLQLAAIEVNSDHEH